MPQPERTITITSLCHRAQVDGHLPRDLVQWLVAKQLAVQVGSRIAPTPEGRRIGAGLAQVERDSAGNR